VARVADATGLGPQRGLRKSKKIVRDLNIQRFFMGPCMQKLDYTEFLITDQSDCL